MISELTAEEAGHKFKARLIGDAGFIIKGVGDPKSAAPSDLCLAASEKYLPFIQSNPARCWVTSLALYEKMGAELKASKIFLISENPFGFFAEVINHFYPEEKSFALIHAQSFIHPTAQIDPTAQIEAFVSVGANATIEAGVILHAGVWIGDSAVVGEGSILFGGVKVYPRSVVGKRNRLHSGAVIGSEGFGFLRQKSGEALKIPQVGRVILGDEVEIGANSCVDRGTLSDTVIGRGTKIDNLVQVGHNCLIGKNAILCAMVGLSGHTTLGDNVLMAGQSVSKGHLKIGDGVQVGGQSGVTKDIAAGENVKGFPARPVKEYFRNQVLLSKMTEIYRRILRLEKKVNLDGKTETDGD